MGYEQVPMDDYENLEEAIADHFGLGEVVVSKFRMGAFYFATVDKGGRIGAHVVLTQDFEGERLFKAMSEREDPVACCCPVEILFMLSADENESAETWRARCVAWNMEVTDLFVNENIHRADAIATFQTENWRRRSEQG